MSRWVKLLFYNITSVIFVVFLGMIIGTMLWICLTAGGR